MVRLVKTCHPLFSKTLELLVRLSRQQLEVNVLKRWSTRLALSLSKLEHVCYLVQTSGVIGITVDFLDEVCHNPQLSCVSAKLNVEVYHVVLRAMPPIGRVIGEIVCVIDDWPFTVLRAGGSVEIEAIQPNAIAVKHFASMLLIDWFRRVRQIEVQINCNSRWTTVRSTTI